MTPGSNFYHSKKNFTGKESTGKKKNLHEAREIYNFEFNQFLVHMEPAVMICHCDKDNGSICLSGHYDERTRVKTIKNLLFRPQFGPFLPVGPVRTWSPPSPMDGQ